MNTINKKMYDFLILNKQTHVKEVLSVNIKQCDDEYGPMGQHYEVSCMVYKFDQNLNSSEQKIDFDNCLVGVREFSNYCKEEKPIKWI